MPLLSPRASSRAARLSPRPGGAPPAGHDAAADPALLDALTAFGGASAIPAVREIGLLAGAEHAQEQGRLANEYPPRLRTHDRLGWGRRPFRRSMARVAEVAARALLPDPVNGVAWPGSWASAARPAVPASPLSAKHRPPGPA